MLLEIDRNRNFRADLVLDSDDRARRKDAAKHGHLNPDRPCSQESFDFIRDPVTMLAVSLLTLTPIS
jgi:hypothetical protein